MTMWAIKELRTKSVEWSLVGNILKMKAKKTEAINSEGGRRYSVKKCCIHATGNVVIGEEITISEEQRD